MPTISADVAEALARSGIDVAALGLGWARALPCVAIVPAFGLRALPGPARAVIALALGAILLPAMAPVTLEARGAPGRWLVLAALEAARGLPVAIAASVPLWAATMAGGVADTMRGSQDSVASPAVEGRATPLGVALSLMAAAIFLNGGGAARVASALGQTASRGPLALAIANDLVAGVTLAVAIASPFLAAGIVVEVAAALIARAASPAQVHALTAPLRSLAALAIAALALERVATAMAAAVNRAP